MPTHNRKTAVLTVRLSPQIKDLLRSTAAGERRSLANMLEIALLEYCSKRSVDQRTTRPSGMRKQKITG